MAKAVICPAHCSPDKLRKNDNLIDFSLQRWATLVFSIVPQSSQWENNNALYSKG